MGKILVIEPQKILQQAISLSLFPEHEVQVKDNVASEVGSFKEYDLLIVDGAALRESNVSMAEVIRAIQGSKTPTLWLEDDTTSQTPKRDKCLVIKKPIEKETFQSALAGLLFPGGPAAERRGFPAAAFTERSVSQPAPKKKDAEAVDQSDFQFIDLVEVVEEEHPPKQGKKAPRKSK